MPVLRNKRGRITAVFLAAALVLYAFTLLVSFGPKASAASSDGNPPRKVAIVVIDRIGLDDLMTGSTPNISHLIADGAVALMNARVKYEGYGRGGYVILGAGGRALGGPNAGLAFNEGEQLKASGGDQMSAAALYKARTGRTAPRGSVVNLYIEEMRELSDTPQTPGVPGLLGWALRKGGRRVTVLGNADSLVPATELDTASPAEAAEQGSENSGYFMASTILHREVSCIAMDTRGMVPRGDVSSDLYVSETTGFETDFERLLLEVEEALPESDVLMVDMGQTTRVDEQSRFYSEKSLARARADALTDCDAALGRLVNMLDLSKDLVAVCVPTPTHEMIEDGNLLTPVVLAGAGFEGGVLLESETTRRTGVVSNYDPAPTVLDSLDEDIPSEMTGTPLTSSNAEADLEGLKSLQDRAVGASETRKTMVRIFAVTAIIVITLFLLVALIREDVISRHRYLFSAILFSVLSAPAVYLVVPSFSVPALSWLVPATVGASLLLGLTLSFVASSRSGTPGSFGGAVPALWAVSGLTAAVILLDTLIGSPLMKLSPFGTDVMLGDRYYGISNLYMGFAVGASILFACLTVSMSRRFLSAPWKRALKAGFLLAAAAFIIGFGRLGANFGGLVTAVAGSLVALFKIEGARIDLKRAGLIAVILVLVVMAVVAVDIALPGAASHTGRAAAQAESGGGSPLLAMASRKLAANWSLSFASIWRLVVLFGLAAFLILNWKSRLLASLKDSAPAIYAAFAGMAAATVVGLLVNDSGIEVAAAISTFLFLPYFIMLIRLPRGEDTPALFYDR